MTLRIKGTAMLPCDQKEQLGLSEPLMKISFMDQNLSGHIRFTTWDQCSVMNGLNPVGNVNSTKLGLKLLEVTIRRLMWKSSPWLVNFLQSLV